MTNALRFADISSNNPLPNVAAYARAGHKHLCVKVTEGTEYRWYDSATVSQQAHGHSLNVGHYHWLRPDSDPIAQAHQFITAVKPALKAGDWLMTDFERTYDASDPSDGHRADQLRQFNRSVHAALGDYPLYVYTGNWYLAGKPACQAACRDWGVVMSDYSGVAKLPNPYHLRYVAWQFTDKAHVAGFSRPVDYNRWLITPGAHPAPAPNTDLLEQIMALDRNSADYKNLVADIAHAVLNAPIQSPVNKKMYALYRYLQSTDSRLVELLKGRN